jgi:hypothetical protein
LLNKQVGGELGISEITVKAHRGKVMLKMQASSLPDLVKMAARLRVGSAQGAAICRPNDLPLPLKRGVSEELLEWKAGRYIQ